MKIYPKLLLILTLAFILFTVAGTISHESGHILVAKSLGYETKLHYGSMTYNYDHVENSILTDSTLNKVEMEKKIRKIESDSLLITMGGPFSTMITTLIGLLIINCRKKEQNIHQIRPLFWIAIFLSLFSLRETIILLVPIIRELITPDGTWFGGDEYFISQRLNFWPGTLSFSLGTVGILIFFFFFLKILKKDTRLTFLLSGLIGGTIGFILWMIIIGPKVLP